MELSPRQMEIMALARTQGRVLVDQLAETFGVTTQTVRRDLNLLTDNGQLNRVHGGAVPATHVSNVDYSERRSFARQGKTNIGARVASLIPSGCSMFLNIGTTTEQVAISLREKRDLVVVTNNINVIPILAGSPDKELILTGGVVRQSDGAIVGDAAVDFIRKFKVDFAVIGCSAMDADGSVLDYDMREVAVARAIIENSRSTILACDATKFERTAPVRICHISALSAFVTDESPPRTFAAVCAEADVDIEIADGSNTHGGAGE